MPHSKMNTPDLRAPILLNLTRNREGIIACVSEWTDQGVPTITTIALDRLPDAVYPQRGVLLDDWRALGCAREIEPVWPAFWRLFWATFSESNESAPAPMPQRVAPPARPVATAAHPRAFRGTKFKPPKPPLVSLDLQAWLADDRLLDGFFARHDFDRWPMTGPDGALWAVDHSDVATPTVASLLAKSGAAGETSLPSVYRRHFLWSLRTQAGNKHLAWLAIWRALGAPTDGKLLAILARLCALDASAHAWAELALGLPGERQPIFLLQLLRHEAFRFPITAMTGEQLGALNALADGDAHFDALLDIALENLGRGVSIAYTLIGAHLPDGTASVESTTRGLRTDSHCDDVPVPAIGCMLATLGDGGAHWARNAWEYCAKLPGFGRILTDTSWESMSSETADRWLMLFRVGEWEFDNPALRKKQWQVRLALFPLLHSQLLALPGERREKFVGMLVDYFWSWDNPKSLHDSLQVLLPMLARLCQPPFQARATGNDVVAAIAFNLPESAWRQLLAIPDRTWLVAERSCRRSNDATLIRYGLSSLAEAAPGFLLQALAFAPKRLMRSMSLLGCLEYNTRRRFLAQVARVPWFETRWDQIGPLEACKAILAHCREYELDSPLPRRLREHLAGTVTLNEAQIARHCRITLTRLPSTQLAALDAMAWREIDGPFNLRAQSEAASHAVRLHASVDGGNRKTLRRFLRAYANGDAHNYLDHPLNAAWHARHPRVNTAIWNSATVRECVEGSQVSISIESDPLEVLMLGSYVGSCLGLGGLCEYSAVACLVDANKQVAYARDAAGRVVARQLLAIDESDRLVCFEVYPHTVDASLKQAFKRFNSALANALSLDLYRDDDAVPYEIQIILAKEWWDDGHWAIDL